ncbi:MAG: response regulator transcription factor [Planctomycetales bacterium]|nr:response regulator transcription factor [Planctomycetales bacterium]
MKSTRILLADDHTLFRSGLRMLLKDVPGIDVVGEATTAAEAERLVVALKPDVLLLDISLPDASGIKLLGKLLQLVPETRTIVVTMHNDAAMVRAALASGAAGYVVKTAADTELITAIRSVADGRTVVHLDLGREELGALVESGVGRKVDAQGPLALLSKREREVFKQLASGYTNQQIADDLDLSVKTVETYRARIGDKLGLRSRADLIRFAIDAGILGSRPA